jgi:hypothetical protein
MYVSMYVCMYVLNKQLGSYCTDLHEL